MSQGDDDKRIPCSGVMKEMMEQKNGGGCCCMGFMAWMMSKCQGWFTKEDPQEKTDLQK
ncbi:MAG: hypothetical protein ACLGPL_03060 [Acidobacteriota bacterium]